MFVFLLNFVLKNAANIGTYSPEKSEEKKR